MRKIVKVLFSLIVILSFSFLSVQASEVSENKIGIMPMYTNINQISASLSLNGTTANCYGTVIGLNGTTYISSSLTLERVNADNTTSFIASWSNYSQSSFLEVTGSKSVIQGYTYRLTHVTNVVRSGATETVTVFVYGKCE